MARLYDLTDDMLHLLESLQSDDPMIVASAADAVSVTVEPGRR